MAQIKSILPGLQQNITQTSSGSEVVSYTSDLGTDKPILTLIHGYPQSAFEWRTVVPLLAQEVSLFVPELPGYGVSTPQEDNSKREIGRTLLEALQKTFQIDQAAPRKVILGGHDRGARIVHRLAVDKDRYPSLHVLGAVMLDIVPTKAQWDNFADPIVGMGYFHWPLLANVEIAIRFIRAFGPSQWVHTVHSRIGGSNAESSVRIAADNAIEVYAENFEKEETLRYSAEDYAAGALVDIDQQKEDQQAGRKLSVPTLVMFSREKLGARQDVEQIWRDWIAPHVAYRAIGVGDGRGHYLPEEAPEEVVKAIVEFVHEVA